MVDDGLEDRLSDLEAATGVREGDVKAWAERRFEEALSEHGFEYEFQDGQHRDRDGNVCIYRERAFEYWLPETEIPDWIDVETDLPAGGGVNDGWRQP